MKLHTRLGTRIAAGLCTLAGLGLLCGCGTVSTPSPARSTTAPTAHPAAGMSMAAAPAAQKPSATQALVCSDDARGDIRTALGLRTDPATNSTYTNALFTCTYHLPAGRMRLSVKHLADRPAALAYLRGRSRSTGAQQALVGLGEAAYGDGNGLVYTIKDNEVLAVDTTTLPNTFGVQQQKRSDLAYEVASIILGCWTGDDDS